LWDGAADGGVQGDAQGDCEVGEGQSRPWVMGFEGGIQDLRVAILLCLL
jgi:hypothetical protein